MTLSDFNLQSVAQACATVSHWCASERWTQQVVDLRPYDSVETLARQATELWRGVSEADILQAFAAQPVIGDVELLRQKYADTARAEQGQVLQADDTVIAELAQLNVDYQRKFGFIFIVFASGKSAAQMRDLLLARIGNNRNQELANGAAEQEKIMLARLHQYFA